MDQKETELLQAVLDARQKVDAIDTELSLAKEIKEKAEAALIEHMDNAELKSFKSTVFKCIVMRKESLYVSVDKEKKEEAFRWIEEDCGRSDLLKMTVHNKTLSSFIGEKLRNGEKVPQELFNYFFRPELSIVQTKIS